MTRLTSEHLKNQLRRRFPIRSMVAWREARAFSAWVKSGRDDPPPALFKQHVVRAYGRRFALATLVETGTFLGRMVEVMAPHFSHVYSIELDESLHRQASARLAHLGNVTLIHGDSGELLGSVLRRIQAPCLLWLDGHYSGGVTARGRDDTPIRRELEHLFAAQRQADVVLIDDARCFDGQNGYPTVDEVVALLERNLKAVVTVADDIIRAQPRWL